MSHQKSEPAAWMGILFMSVILSLHSWLFKSEKGYEENRIFIVRTLG